MLNINFLNTLLGGKRFLALWSRQSARYSKLADVILILIVVAVPAVFTYYLITFQLDKQLLDFIPQWSDEIFNWHQVATFRAVGFNGGYYTVNEQPAVIPFIHFYTHGPLYPMLFGAISLGFGWEVNSALFFNVTLLTLSIALFIGYTKPNKLQLLLIGLAVLTFWPAHLYMATNMRQVVFDALSVVIAAFFYRTLIAPDIVSRRHLILFFCAIVLLTLLKVTNAIFFLPYFLLIRHRMGFSLVRATLTAIVLMILSFFIYTMSTAPYPNFASILSTTFSHSLAAGLQLFFQHAWGNISNFFNYSDHPLLFMLRAQLLLIIIAGIWLLFIKCNGKRVTQEGMFILVAAAGTAVGGILLYDISYWKDFRLFSPVVLMITLLFVARKRVLLVSLIIASNLAILPTFVATYSDRIGPAFPDIRWVLSVRSFSERIAPVIKYNKDTDGWGNTLLAPLPIASDRRMLGVPAGIGISWFDSPYELANIKSRYLLLDDESYKVLKERAFLEFKFSTPIGNLYINKSGMR